MALKLDLSGVKSFFLERGERVGMVACLLAAGVLVGYAVSNGLSAKYVPKTTRTYPEALKGEIDKVRGAQQQGESPANGAVAVSRGPEWDEYRPEFSQSRFWERNDIVSNKRTNPRAVAPMVDSEGKHVQMNYFRGGVFAFDVNTQLKTATTFKAAPKDLKPAVKPFFPFPAPQKDAARGAATNVYPLVNVVPVRMVVVHAVFPLGDQLKEFRKAFRMLNEYELFASKDLPRFLGMNVMKTEVVDGKPPVWRPLVQTGFDGANEKIEVDPALLALLRQAIFDDATPQFPHALIQGLAMPLPKLASLPPNNVYPNLDLAGVQPPDENAPDAGNPIAKLPFGMPGEKQPGMGAPPPMGGRGAEVELDTKFPWTRLAPDLKEKLNDGYYVLDPFGVHPDPDEPKDPTKAVAVPLDPRLAPAVSPFKGSSMFSAAKFWERYPAPPPPPMTAAGEKAPAPMPPMLKPYDALIRFIDVDVKPGRTYKYSIQVRIANPNYGKKGEVAFAALADIKELKPADPVETPTIAIPEEFFLYAVDQKPDNAKVVNGSDDKDAKPDQVAVQIHRWVGITGDRNADVEYPIADWAIAERILLQRGDPVGRLLNVEIPVWDKKRGTYDLGSSTVGAMGAPGKKGGVVMPPKNLGKQPLPGAKDLPAPETVANGIPVDFVETSPAPILVDFDGGKKSIQADGKTIADASASNLLILRADGQLIVRNTRIDSDPDSEATATRLQRIEEWRQKLGLFRGPGENNPNPRRPPPAKNDDPFGFFKKPPS